MCALSWLLKYVYTMMHGQRNIKVFYLFRNLYAYLWSMPVHTFTHLARAIRNSWYHILYQILC
jgi:hypothetical protein